MSKIRYLHPDEIECRVAKIFDNGLTLLLYKTARTDMTVLDEVFGQDNWCDDYKEVKGNLYCGISVKTKDGWITKWDCGIESRGNDGNEKKGEASDAFKRAGTKWGIGRELYTSPKMIWVKASDVQLKEVKGKKVTYDTFSVVKIECVDGKISFLQIKNDRTGKIVYTLSKDNQGNKPDTADNPDRERCIRAYNVLKMTPEQLIEAKEKNGGSYKKTAEYLEGLIVDKEAQEAKK